MIAYPYLRVSGKTQVDGDGPERQSEKIIQFCGRHQLPLGGCYFDAGVSGTVDSLDRPQLARLLDDAKPGDCIVVERMDRLARDLIVQEVLLAECRKRQLKVFSVDTGDTKDVASNDGDPTLVLIRQILGAVAQWEKSVLVMKMKAGAERKRRETGRCGGVVPYGNLPDEADSLKYMLNLRQSGHPLSHIAGSMNLSGIKTRSGKEWTKARVHNAIARHTGAKS